MFDCILFYNNEDKEKYLTSSGVLFIIHLHFCTF